MDGRVSMLDTAGRTRVLRDDVPSANGITVHQGRLFIGECREGGRLLEFDLAGGPPRVLLENVPSPNAMEVGPDGLLYFPVMGANEIWRIDPDGGEATVCRRRSRCARLGQVRLAGLHRLDSGGQRAGAAHRSSQRRTAAAGPAQSGAGQLHVRRRPAAGIQLHRRDHRDIAGRCTRGRCCPAGLTGRLDLTVGHDGQLYIADGTYFYVALPDGSLHTVGNVVQPRLSRIPARRCDERTRRVRRDDLGGPGRPLPAGSERKRGAGRRFRPALRCRRQLRTAWSSPNWAPGGCCRCGRATSEVLATDLRDPGRRRDRRGRGVPGGTGRRRYGWSG